jgi:hypothetical protein
LDGLSIRKLNFDAKGVVPDSSGKQFAWRILRDITLIAATSQVVGVDE